MPTEFRRIVLTNDELLDAIALYNRAAKQKLPVGRFESCTVKDEQDLIVTLEICDISTDKRYNIDLKAAYIGASIIKWCQGQKIPIPRSAAKTVEAVGDNIALHLTINGKSDDLFDVAEGGGAESAEPAEASDGAEPEAAEPSEA